MFRAFLNYDIIFYIFQDVKDFGDKGLFEEFVYEKSSFI